MGNESGDKWMDALPWVLLGKRVQVQPDLDISAAQLTFGKSLSLPGHLLGHPGAPLSNLQTKALLEQLYKLSARPPVQTSSVPSPGDLSKTDGAKHVYVKMEDPAPLAPRYEGPFQIADRPSKSTVNVRIGSFVSGQPRLQTYNWNTCKVARMREGAPVGSRPNLGRKRKNPSTPSSDNSSNTSSEASSGPPPEPSNSPVKRKRRGRPRGRNKNHTETPEQPQAPVPDSDKPDNPTWSPRPGPGNCNFGPVITRQMYDNWTPEMLDINPSRPVRSTRNSNPQYIESQTQY